MKKHAYWKAISEKVDAESPKNRSSQQYVSVPHSRSA